MACGAKGNQKWSALADVRYQEVSYCFADWGFYHDQTCDMRNVFNIMDSGPGFDCPL